MRSSRPREPRLLPRALRDLFPKVKEVADANAPVSVTVTEEDCDKRAVALNPEECAMARALKRQYKADGVIIGLTKSYLIRGKKATRFATPVSVAREITSFDRHHDFAPGTYRLSAIPPTGRFGARPDRPRGNDGTGGKTEARRIVHNDTVRVRRLPRG